MATVDELTLLLNEAKTARHTLLLGRAVAVARDIDGSEVRYTQADSAKLAAYITQLEAEIAALSGDCTNIGPMRVFF